MTSTTALGAASSRVDNIRRSLVGLKMPRRGRLRGVGQGVEVVVAAHFGAPVVVDQQIARSAIEQGAHIENGAARMLGGENACIAFLRQVGRRIAVADLALQKMKQFAVVAL